MYRRVKVGNRLLVLAKVSFDDSSVIVGVSKIRVQFQGVSVMDYGLLVGILPRFIHSNLTLHYCPIRLFASEEARAV